MKNKPLFIVVGIIIVLLISGAVGWVVFAPKPTASTSTNQSSQTSTSQSTNNTNNTQTPSGDSSGITSEQLGAKNGKNGQACWVAVDGTVYEISGFALWADGLHRPSGGRAMCGKDLSDAINQSPHGKSKLKLLKEVGKLSQ